MSETLYARNSPDLTAVKGALKDHRIELPSWAPGDGTRRRRLAGNSGNRAGTPGDCGGSRAAGD